MRVAHNSGSYGIGCAEVIPVDRRAGKGKQHDSRLREMLPSLILSACFVAAALLGCLMAQQAGEGSMEALECYLLDYLSMYREIGGVSPSLWTVIWELCRWPVFIFILGFTALGAMAIPAIFCIRGFLLSYAVAVFLRVFGRVGAGAALAAFGVPVLGILPAMFLLGRWAFPSAVRLALGALGEGHMSLLAVRSLHVLLPGGAILGVAVFLQWSVMPQLLAVACTGLTLL